MIRLIKTTDLSQHVFEGRSVPEYAILSHRWEDEEISLQELQGKLNQHKKGWLKLCQFCQYARQRGHDFVWMDTCSIDKTSSAELSEAINSMFKWYRRAVCCYAYLCDVPARGGLDVSEWMKIFKSSKWFIRGWTLQELLAPQKLTFVCSNWEEDVGTRESLSNEVGEVTRIPWEPLVHGWSLKDGLGSTRFTVAQVMSWASERRTTRIEDTAYSLMGLFHINMPLLYGEGSNAFIRLQLEIMSKYDDNSLFAWQIPPNAYSCQSIRALNRALDIPEAYWWGGLLAPTIRCFQDASYSLHLEKYEDAPPFSMTSRGVQVEGLSRSYGRTRSGTQRWLLLLDCGPDASWSRKRVGFVLSDHCDDVQTAARVMSFDGLDTDLVECDLNTEQRMRNEYKHRRFFIPQAWPGDFD